MHKLAIFASGTGTNTQAMINYFRANEDVHIGLIVCNKPGAGVLEIAKNEGIASFLLDKEKFFRGDAYVDELRNYGITFIVLAGFLWKVPASMVNAFPNRIINIHPALLPAHGGKGMYGSKVHEAVINAHEHESGISIHFVDEAYDHGSLIFQATCVVDKEETPESLAAKIHFLEHQHYPRVLEKVLKDIG